jgi:hypothetical protein
MERILSLRKHNLTIYKLIAKYWTNSRAPYKGPLPKIRRMPFNSDEPALIYTVLTNKKIIAW